ncbi:MAG: DEAD/DEAH box helicase [Nitrospirae bacterium]|nr:MAG: DEAD/DEAH box helicase [Nitrospirota bacterium]
MALTPHQARYFAYDLTRRGATGLDRLSMALFDAAVDLNPHQIEAALFALQSPLSKGVILCDEVGLGKTIEAGIVLCQLWAEHKRRLLVLCPASLRKQWALELEEKFNLPVFVLDAKAYRAAQRRAEHPLDQKAVIIMSYPYANRLREDIKAVAWDLVVMDEAHKLRNAYRPSNKIGQGLRWATEDCRKLLLTATPLQNSLLELYGLATLIDEHLFGDIDAFRAQFMGAGGNLHALRQRLQDFTKRTLRKQVSEYIRYTERRAITQPFCPTDYEQHLYEAVSDFLRRDETYAIPKRQRHLTQLILRKLLASSSRAIAATLEMMQRRLEALRDTKLTNDREFLEGLAETEDLDEELLDEILESEEAPTDDSTPSLPVLDRAKLQKEMIELQQLATWARAIGTDAKSVSLLKALATGFAQMDALGARKKALIFTESRRTQDYLAAYLEEHGYRDQIVVFNGTNAGPQATAIYERWRARPENAHRSSGSRAIDMRTALIEHFRDHATIMIATEAGAEGLNLQFCSLVINYDLPWNPQRIEQRIGRCHRYGQQHDVVVINFLNERNAADRRVLELLTEKFQLFTGLFGASDEVLGTIESGVDFEKRILAIYQECRTPEEIDAAFAALQAELEERIQARLDEARKTLFEHFDEDVHARLRLQLQNAQDRLDRFGKRFWEVTKTMLERHARFDDASLTFDLHTPPIETVPSGRYHLIAKRESGVRDAPPMEPDRFLYRLSHPLGQHVIAQAKALETPTARLVFDISHHPTRISVVEALRGNRGWLILSRLEIESYEREEYVLFSAFDRDGRPLDQEICEKLLGCRAHVAGACELPQDVAERLAAESKRHAEATISRSLETNNRHFQQAREKLEQWADDMVLAAEKALKDTKEQIKVLRRRARQAATLAEQHEIQVEMHKLEKRQRQQRREIFRIEDEIIEKRDALIDQLEKRMIQKTNTEPLFTIAWEVV